MLTPLQQKRRDAALKAAATKRRKAAAAAGQHVPFSTPYYNQTPPPSPGPKPPRPAWTPPPPPPYTPPRPAPTAAFSTPKPTLADKRAAVVAALEDLFVLVCRDSGVTDERRKAFDTYKKALALAVGPTRDQSMQNEAAVALRMAALALVKQVF